MIFCLSLLFFAVLASQKHLETGSDPDICTLFVFRLRCMRVNWRLSWQLEPSSSYQDWERRRASTSKWLNRASLGSLWIISSEPQTSSLKLCRLSFLIVRCATNHSRKCLTSTPTLSPAPRQQIKINQQMKKIKLKQSFPVTIVTLLRKTTKEQELPWRSTISKSMEEVLARTVISKQGQFMN